MSRGSGGMGVGRAAASAAGGRGRGPGGSGGLGALSGGGKKINPDTLKRLLEYVGRYKVRLVFVAICIVVSAGSGVASSLFLRALIDDFIMPLVGSDKPVLSGLVGALAIMAVIYAVGVLAGLFYNRTMAVVAQSTLKVVRDDMFRHMQKLPIRFFDGHTHGELMSYYTNDADTLRQMISQSLPSLFTSIISMTAVLISMLYLSLWMTLVVLAFTAVMLFAVKNIAGVSGKYFMAQQESIADVNGYIEEMVNGQKVVKVFCREKKAAEAFNEKNNILKKNASSANSLANILMPLLGSMSYILYVLIAIIGGVLAIKGVRNVSFNGEELVTLGTIASFLTLSRNFVNPIAQVSQQLNSVIMAMAGATRIFKLLDEPEEVDGGHVVLVNARKGADGELTECRERTGVWAWKVAKSSKNSKDSGTDSIEADTLIEVKGKIDLKEVDFGYVEDKPVLHDISVYAEPGQKVALVGATGAGKTTITNLINRFYDIDDGKIQYDGISINDIKKEDLRRSLGVVLQDVNLFTDTVLENIRYGNPDATDEDCINAAKLVHADSFIRMLPKGYDTLLEGDGSGLSQGQRQLISIARAAVADPPVMILDEATSSIDTRTEALVQKGMDNLMKGRTVFVIAHRLSTIQNADVIMMMEDGRIIERGSHEKLMADKGKYYQLYKGTFELE